MTENQTEKAHIWHAPQPGPLYWNWRCLRCSEPVAQHASWWRRVLRRLRGSRASARRQWIAPRIGGYQPKGSGPRDPKPPTGPGAVVTSPGITDPSDLT